LPEAFNLLMPLNSFKGLGTLSTTVNKAGYSLKRQLFVGLMGKRFWSAFVFFHGKRLRILPSGAFRAEIIGQSKRKLSDRSAPSLKEPLHGRSGE